MAAKETIRRFDIPEAELDSALSDVVTDFNMDAVLELCSVRLQADTIVPAKVLSHNPDASEILVDIGGKAEAPISFSEFEDDGLPEIGAEFEVFYYGDNRQTSVPVVSKQEADRERAWSKVVGIYEPGDVLEGTVKKKIKGGLLISVDGVMVFMPASQIDLRRTAEPSDFIDQEIRCRIVKVDEARRNIVVSRRQLLEEEREEKRAGLLQEIEEGQIRKGEVKNIADFGAFVDLGGIDGLLHVTDMSHGRVKHPREILKMGDIIEVCVTKIDRDRNRVALSMKALAEDPWANLGERYPLSTVHEGRIANIVPYGMFVELEAGVEGLVHVSEISWTRQSPALEKEFERGQVVKIFIKAIDLEKKEMSLSVREVEGNPWDRIAESYAPGTVIEATVKNLASYGAFVEIEEGIDGLLHNSDIHWTRKVQHPSELVKKGDRIQCVVLGVEKDKQRISLGMKQLTQNPWEDYIPSNYHVGDMLAGTVTKSVDAGCFVRLEDELEAFLHYSTLPQEWQDQPETHCIPELRMEVRVVRVDCGDERIGLSFLHADFEENEAVRASWVEAQERRRVRAAARKAAKAAAAAEAEAEGASVAEDSSAEDASEEENPAEEGSEQDSGAEVVEAAKVLTAAKVIEAAETAETATEDATTEEAPAEGVPAEEDSKAEES